MSISSNGLLPPPLYSPQENSSESNVSIITHNREQLRQHIITRFIGETLIGGEVVWRSLYLDTEGQLQGIWGPDKDPMKLNEKIKRVNSPLITVNINIKLTMWNPQREPAFTWKASVYESTLPKKIFDTMIATLNELNQLAQGAYKLALKEGKVGNFLTPAWESYFCQVKDYPSSVLKQHAI